MDEMDEKEEEISPAQQPPPPPRSLATLARSYPPGLRRTLRVLLRVLLKRPRIHYRLIVTLANPIRSTCPFLELRSSRLTCLRGDKVLNLKITQSVIICHPHPPKHHCSTNTNHNHNHNNNTAIHGEQIPNISLHRHPWSDNRREGIASSAPSSSLPPA